MVRLLKEGGWWRWVEDLRPVVSPIECERLRRWGEWLVRGRSGHLAFRERSERRRGQRPTRLVPGVAKRGWQGADGGGERVVAQGLGYPWALEVPRGNRRPSDRPRKIARVGWPTPTVGRELSSATPTNRKLAKATAHHGCWGERFRR